MEEQRNGIYGTWKDSNFLDIVAQGDYEGRWLYFIIENYGIEGFGIPCDGVGSSE